MPAEKPGNRYFDNAATSWPKPEPVYRAAEKYLRLGMGNPGRSGHTRSLESDRLVFNARELTAKFFNAGEPSRIIFTLNATDALNMAIKGLLEPGDHVLYTAMEHNSVLRPIGGLRRRGLITASMVPCSRNGTLDLNRLECAFQPRTRLLVCNHASNVTGGIIPLDEIIAVAHARGAYVLVDAAQSAGIIPIDVANQEIDLLAFAGHKGLLGPPGTGGLYVRPGINLKPWREGGTGSFSDRDLHPETMPERLEAGTMNVPGLAGLCEGIKFIQDTGIPQIRQHEQSLRSYLVDKLQAIPGVTVFGPADSKQCVAVISFLMDGVDSGELGYILESTFDIICRTGLHCAPLAHQAIGTFPQGTVRISPGYFTTFEDADYLVNAVAEISTAYLQ